MPGLFFVVTENLQSTYVGFDCRLTVVLPSGLGLLSAHFGVCQNYWATGGEFGFTSCGRFLWNLCG